MGHPAFALEVITPEGKSFGGRVTSARLPGRAGQFGVLARHAPLVAALDAGMLRLEPEGGRAQIYAVGEGFVEIGKSGVRVLVDFFNTKEQVDVERAERARARARERLRERRGDVDLVRAEASLRRALARLQVARHPATD
jgi:F-type H+-transporting ATPase subunit epsilon